MLKQTGAYFADGTKQISVVSELPDESLDLTNIQSISQKKYFFNHMMSYYPEYFGIIQPGHENETFWRKHLSWLDQAILLGLLIFISISLNTLWSLKHKKKKLFQLKSSTQCPWTTDHEVYSGACQHCWALTWAREYITCLTLLTLYSTRLACNMHCMCFFEIFYSRKSQITPKGRVINVILSDACNLWTWWGN